MTVRYFWGLLVAAMVGHHVSAQSTPERTIDEIKVETQARAERGAYPLTGLDPTDVREALANITTRDRDEWAAAWGAVADRYDRAAAAATSMEDRRTNYLRAWRRAGPRAAPLCGRRQFRARSGRSTYRAAHREL